MQDFKKYLEEKNVEIVFVKNALLSFKWDSAYDEQNHMEIRKNVNKFLETNGLKDGTRVTGSCSINIKDKNLDEILIKAGFEPMTEKEYMDTYIWSRLK